MGRRASQVEEPNKVKVGLGLQVAGTVDTTGQVGPEGEELRLLDSTPLPERVEPETNFMHLHFVVIWAGWQPVSGAQGTFYQHRLS